jgi:glycosyltransferase involved in cell wall biosynthesis
VADVILPVLNEAQALPWVLERIPSGFDPIVVDNGSTDGSANVAARLGALVVTEPRAGFGAACFAGLMAASAPVVCFMDADGSLDPRELRRVIVPVLDDQADLVLGARRAAVPWAWPAHARAANRALAWELRRRTELSLTDLGPMRAARREPLLALGLVDRRFGWPLEMVLRAASAGWRVQEVEVSYLPRRGGRSKVSGSVRGTLRAVRDMAAALAEAPG